MVIHLSCIGKWRKKCRLCPISCLDRTKRDLIKRKRVHTVPPMCSQSWSLLTYCCMSDFVTNLILFTDSAFNICFTIFQAAVRYWSILNYKKKQDFVSSILQFKTLYTRQSSKIWEIIKLKFSGIFTNSVLFWKFLSLQYKKSLISSAFSENTSWQNARLHHYK